MKLCDFLYNLVLHILAKFQGHTMCFSKVMGHYLEPPITKTVKIGQFLTLSKHNSQPKQLQAMILHTQYPSMMVFQKIYESLFKTTYDVIYKMTSSTTLGRYFSGLRGLWEIQLIVCIACLKYLSSKHKSIIQLSMGWFSNMTKYWYIYLENVGFR